MTKIKIVCPKCSKKGFFEVPEDVLKNVSRGVMSVNIPQDLFCEHSYLVYIDKNFQIRDYFFTDFEIELPKLSAAIDIKEEKLSSPRLEEFSSIKLFITAASLSYIIKGILSKKEIILIVDDPHLKNNFQAFFSFLTQNSYQTNINILNMEEYKDKKKKYKDYLVVNGSKLLNNPKKFFNPKKLQVEKQIVGNFLVDDNLNHSLLLFKNEIYKSYKYANKIVELVNTKDDKGQINILKLSNELEKIFDIKLNTSYMNFLVEIVRDYFEIDLLSISESFLGLLWK